MLRGCCPLRLARTDVTLRTPVNWPAVIFFGALGALHLFMAGTAIYHGRWDGYLSGIFGVVFTFVAIVVRVDRDGARRAAPSSAACACARARGGSTSSAASRSRRCRSVRLTLLNARRPQSSTIELVCDHEVIECPPTMIPREEALCLAMTLGVRLVKVFGDTYGPVSDRIGTIPTAPLPPASSSLPPSRDVERPNDSRPSNASDD